MYEKVLIKIEAETEKGQSIFQNEIIELTEAKSIKHYIEGNKEKIYMSMILKVI